MESKRQAKIARYIQKELSEIFRRQTARMGGVLVSVSQVRVSPDLSIAKAYLSIFPTDKSAEILENIKAQGRTVRYELAQAVKDVLRKCPELQFYLDDSLDYAENIDRLLASDPIKGTADDYVDPDELKKQKKETDK
ncbi:MAG: 30S ribosome-binding factor RbfA [Muribaculaceae bacterium]|nr:30S ribosome-binding factor RbfA [Muribaculaceae bacterium]